MNLVALLVAVIELLFLPFTLVGIVSLVRQAIRASRADSAGEEKALAGNLLSLILLAVWIGGAGFRAFTDPATYDVTRYTRMSGREQKKLVWGVLGSGAGFVCLAVYGLQQRNANRRRRSDEAVARAIEEWKGEQD